MLGWLEVETSSRNCCVEWTAVMAGTASCSRETRAEQASFCKYNNKINKYDKNDQNFKKKSHLL